MRVGETRNSYGRVLLDKGGENKKASEAPSERGQGGLDHNPALGRRAATLRGKSSKRVKDVVLLVVRTQSAITFDPG